MTVMNTGPCVRTAVASIDRTTTECWPGWVRISTGTQVMISVGVIEFGSSTVYRSSKTICVPFVPARSEP
jgi:hypothetical protein